MAKYTRAAAFEDATGNLLMYFNYKVVHIQYRSPSGEIINRVNKGFPDFIAVHKTKVCPTLAIECKTGKGKLTPEQKVWKEILLFQEFKWFELRDTVDDLLNYLEKLHNDN